MFGRSLKLFSLLGFDIKVDFSWVFLAILVTWSLATGYFPAENAGFDTTTYWSMGAAGAFGLFFSIVFHELSHSVVARAYGMKIKGITLFIFGGVAELEDEPPGPMAEFLVAIAGPIASLVLAFLSFQIVGLWGPGEKGSMSPGIAVIGYLGLINLILALFNMLPAFPLDGGRALRAILWGVTGSMRRATRIAAGSGSLFGLGFIFIGVYFFIFTSNHVGGLWWALIGLFLRGAAGAALTAQVTQRSMAGETVSRFMVRDPVALSPDLDLQSFVDTYLYHHFHDVFPVVDSEGIALGLLQTKKLHALGGRDLTSMSVRDLMEPVGAETMVPPDLDATRAINLMNRSGNARLLVVDHGKLVGILTLRDMLRLLELKMDLDPMGAKAD